MIFPSRTLNVNVRQYGQVIGVSMVNGSSSAMRWCFVVPIGPLQIGQLMITVSISDHSGMTVRLTSYFAEKLPQEPAEERCWRPHGDAVGVHNRLATRDENILAGMEEIPRMGNALDFLRGGGGHFP